MRAKLLIGLLLILVIMAGEQFLTPFPEPARATPDYFTQDTEIPFNTIYEFYRAVGENNWSQVRRLTSPALWNYLQGTSFVSDWEGRRAKNSKLDFVFFLVMEYGLDTEKGRAWALGQTRWANAGKHPPNSVQTVFLQRFPDGWKLIRIDHHAAVQVAENFYQAINTGDWGMMRELTLPQYWNRLEASGVLRALQEEQSSSRTGVYVVFHITDFAEGTGEAWVSGDVVWRPLTPLENETPATIRLVRHDGRWKVARIIGHWTIAK